MTTMRCASAVAGLVLAAGMAFGQPAVNGRLKPEYGPIQWVNSTPTQFGNAGPAVAPPCDPIGRGVKVALNNTNRAGIMGGTGAADQAAASIVATGYEIKIPLDALGMNIANNGANLPDPVVVSVAGVVTQSDYGATSNQWIGGLGGIPGTQSPNNYPGSSTVDLTTVPGNQFVTVSIPRATLLALASGDEPTLDGTRDQSGSYGAALFIQDTQTNYGDATTSNGANDTVFRANGGSEIDGVYGRYGKDAAGIPALYLMITGNFESNFNKLALFFDSVTGGQNQLTSDNATQTGTFGSIFNGGANAFGGPGTPPTPGLKFDAGFAADYFMSLTVGGGGDASPTVYSDWQRLRTSPTDAGSARFIGGTTATQNGGILTATDPCPTFVPPNYADVANGSEIDGLYAMVCGQYLYVLVTGNLENNGNRLDLFFDVGSVSVPLPSTGQNRLLGNSLPFDFGHLNRLGTDPMNAMASPGLRFSSGFDADYWMSLANTGTSPNVTVNAWAGLINTTGAANDGGLPTPNYLEYGSFAGGPKATNSPLVFDGTKCVRFDMANTCVPNGLGTPFNPMSIPGIDIQGDATINGLPLIPEIYSSYAPRLISRDVFNPFGVDDTAHGHPAPGHGNYAEAGLISTAIDNSNFGGATDTSTAGANRVTTGIEVKIRLDELGYSESGPISVAGFIVSEDHSFVSNQVIGGNLGPVQGNLGEPRTIDFQDINVFPGGPFYVTITPGSCAVTAAGACCFDMTTCVLMSSAQCSATSGTYFGDASACSPNPCGGNPTTGICCRGSTCAITASGGCTVSTGTAGARFVAGSACNTGGSTTTPCCYADYNKQNSISVQDIFDFLNDWFAGLPNARVGSDGSGGPLTVQNIFDFLNAWFAGGC